jgi:hypothetical protein
MLDALGAWEALEGTFKVPTERTHSLEIRVWLQRWNIDSNEGGNFIVGDGCVHF